MASCDETVTMHSALVQALRPMVHDQVLTLQAVAAMERQMSFLRKSVILAALCAAGVGSAVTPAEARDGRNAATLAGAALGVLAGAAIANAASGDELQQVGWYGYDEPRYFAPPAYYVRPRRYIPVYPPAYSETYVIVKPGKKWHRGWKKHDRRWRRHHEWRRWHDEDEWEY